MDASSNIFQLFDQTPSQDHIFAEVSCGHLQFALDLNILVEHSDLVKSILPKTKSFPKGKQVQTFINDFNDKYKEACESFRINQLNMQLFLCILTGKRQTLFNSDLFDFFNLARFFEISKFSEHIEKYCEKLKTPNEILSVLANRKILKEEEKNFNEFLNCGHMKEKLSENIHKCLQYKNFRSNLPLSSIYKIFHTNEIIRSSILEYDDQDIIANLKKENEALKQSIIEIQEKSDKQIKALKDEISKLKKIPSDVNDNKKVSDASFSSSSTKKTPNTKSYQNNSKFQKNKEKKTFSNSSKKSQVKKEVNKEKLDSESFEKSQENISSFVEQTDDGNKSDKESINSNDDHKSEEKNDNKSESSDSDSSKNDKKSSSSDDDKLSIDNFENDSDDKKNSSNSDASKNNSNDDDDKNKSDDDKISIDNFESNSDDKKDSNNSDSNNEDNENKNNSNNNSSINISDNFDDDFVED